MPNQALYLKYRPRVFEDMIGQEHITHSLQNAIAQDRIRHAYLFSGPRGTGKTTLARILAKAVNCEYEDAHLRPCDQCQTCQAIGEGSYLDLIEIDAASNNGVDDVRDLRDKIGFAPNKGRYKVYVIDEVHRFSGAAFDALLKTLEEPPDHALFILATTEMDKVPATIKSRCLKFEFRRVPVQTVAQRLGQIAALEGVTIDADALELVARQGTGSVRDSISLLDQVIADPATRLTRADTEQILGTAGYRAVGDLVQAIIDQDPARGLAILNQSLDEGADPRQFGGQTIDHLRNVLLTQIGGAELVDTSNEQRAVLQAQAEQVGRVVLLRAIRLFNTALNEMRGGWQPYLPLELALAESTRTLAEPMAASNPRGTTGTGTARHAAAAPAPIPEPPPEESEDNSIPTNVPAVPGVVSLAEVQKQWPAILEVLRQSSQLPLISMLQNAAPRSVEGDQLLIAIQNSTLIDRVSDPKNEKVLGDAVRKVLRNKQIKIKIIQVRATTDQPMSEPLAKFVQSVSVETIRPDDSED